MSTIANRERTLSREVNATQIPSGDKQALAAGAKVFIHQTLGGSYTVQTDFGLFRIDGVDADALGEKVTDNTVAGSTLADGAPDPEAIWAQLRQVFDPEIPVNIVDLGLIYSLEATDEPDGRGKHLQIAMTLTAPGCGMGPSIAADAEQRVLGVPGVASARVEVVWDPPWSPERISPAGREKLGMV
jgi:probable FeS assembly SUF system protein SufT